MQNSKISDIIKNTGATRAQVYYTVKHLEFKSVGKGRHLVFTEEQTSRIYQCLSRFYGIQIYEIYESKINYGNV